MQNRSLANQSERLKQWITSNYLRPLFNPLVKVRCPFCLKKSYPGHTAIVSRRQREADGSYTVVVPAPLTQGWRGYLARCWVRPLDGVEYLYTRRQCPYCKELWPPRFERAENHIIAILGARGSGKSCYIAVTIKTLSQTTAIESLRVSPASDEVDKTFHALYDRFLEQGRPIQATVNTTIQPLIYELTWQKTSEGGSTRRVNIILYDVPGEMLLNRYKAEELPFLFQASAVVYLADPLAIDSIWAYWKGKEGIGDDRPEAGVAEVLKMMTPGLEAMYGASTFPGPVAIALSKSDLVEEIHFDSEEDYLFARRPTYEQPNGKIGRKEFTNINKEVKRLLQELDQNTQQSSDLERLAGPLLAASRWFPKHLFFAVSPTGCRPTKNVFEHLQPRRCLDPLFWILSELGIIEIE